MQQPYSLNLRSTAAVIDLHQKFLVLHERVETAIIENVGMDKHILLKIVGGDKAIAKQIIEEFDDGAHVILSWFCGCWWFWRERSVDRQQILNDLTMFVRCQEYADLVTGQKSDQTKSVQR